MNDFRNQMFVPDPEPEAPPRAQPGIVRMVASIAPAQRMLLSIFLFMDTCVICFMCLFLFGKIALPF
jgi:hypothetical protein